jgi:hypothetical protein
MDFWNGYPVIDDGTPNDVPFDPQYSRGAVPRDYNVQPVEMLAQPSEMALIPRSEWDARIDEQEAQKSSLEHIYLSGSGGGPRFINLDQNGNGYCWAYSTGHTMMLARLRDNAPLVRLNPHSVAAIIKGGRDEGGWCGLSAQFLGDVGIAPEGDGPGEWPLHSRNLSRDTPSLRAEMAKYKSGETWIDLAVQAWQRNLTVDQVATCLLGNQPCAVDFNWWGHSVCAVRWVRVEAGSYGLLILNSWLNWGRYGLSVLRGSKMIPDGAVCIRTPRLSA